MDATSLQPQLTVIGRGEGPYAFTLPVPWEQKQEQQVGKMYGRLDNLIKEVTVNGFYLRIVFEYFAQLSLEDINTAGDIPSADDICKLAHEVTNLHNYYTIITYLFTLKHQKNPFFPHITFTKLPYPHYYDVNGDVLKTFKPKPNHIYDWLTHPRESLFYGDDFVLFEYSLDGIRTASYTYQPAHHKDKVITEQIYGKNKLEFSAKPELFDARRPNNVIYEIILIHKSDDDKIYFHHRYNNKDILFEVQVIKNKQDTLATTYINDGITCLELTDKSCRAEWILYANQAVEKNMHHFEGFYLAKSPITNKAFHEYSV
jgi:hypothetical protein